MPSCGGRGSGGAGLTDRRDRRRRTPQGQYDNERQQCNKDAESKGEDKTMVRPQLCHNAVKPYYSNRPSRVIVVTCTRCRTTYVAPALRLPDVKTACRQMLGL